MKNILLLLFFVISCRSYTQQTIVPLRTYTDIPEDAGYYMKDTNDELSAFEGTWKGTWNNKTLFITFKKIIYRYNTTLKYHADIIIGKFKTVDSNGNILFNNLQLTDNDAKVRGVGFQNITNKYIMSYTDNDICGMSGTIYISFANAAKTQLNIYFDQRNQILDTDCYFYNYSPDQYPEPLPKDNIILTKQ
ncbi:MAG: hypothetical protein K0R77_3062 [Chryseobacterium sp.]|jgi:hypothetical protein|uniref:DUF6705 family protein n=1 Tax=Chryseobacterium sp. TaxID=1871047 RepID=UPI002602FA04|nr:DUF6705 family protein [Chryseobacterium sp.]MDF2553787.1 hypothetical protein [Chryseobacterium sp.]